MLAAPDGAGAVASSGAIIDVEPARKTHQVLAGWPDGHAVALFAVAFAQDTQRFVNALAPQVAGVVQRHLAVCDIGVDRLFGLALEDQAIEAGPLQLGRGPAAHVRVGHGAAQRRLGDNCQTTAHVDIGAGERAIHDAQDVIWRERLDLRAVVEDILDAEAAGAQVFAGICFVDALVLHGAGCQVDPGNTVSKSTDHLVTPLENVGWVYTVND